MSTNITVTITGEEAQYLLDAIDTHVKTHGLKVATRGVVILTKLQAATGDQVPKVASVEAKGNQEHESLE